MINSSVLFNGRYSACFRSLLIRQNTVVVVKVRVSEDPKRSKSCGIYTILFSLITINNKYNTIQIKDLPCVRIFFHKRHPYLKIKKYIIVKPFNCTLFDQILIRYIRIKQIFLEVDIFYGDFKNICWVDLKPIKRQWTAADCVISPCYTLLNPQRCHQRRLSGVLILLADVLLASAFLLSHHYTLPQDIPTPKWFQIHFTILLRVLISHVENLYFA